MYQWIVLTGRATPDDPRKVNVVRKKYGVQILSGPPMKVEYVAVTFQSPVFDRNSVTVRDGENVYELHGRIWEDRPMCYPLSILKNGVMIEDAVEINLSFETNTLGYLIQD